MKAPPRLFVVLASRTPRAVILRRGPSNWYHVILWDTGKDTFEHGAWFRGRIYEDRCDLSPDGELLVYFALQGSRFQTSYKGSWTAVSRPPWLHALALWPQGDTWGGGGAFTADRKLTLATSSTEPHPKHRMIGLEVSTGHVARKPQKQTTQDADWSGTDHDGRIIFTRGGKLYRRIGAEDRELADFNGLTPDPQPPPDRAKAPPKAKRSKRR